MFLRGELVSNKIRAEADCLLSLLDGYVPTLAIVRVGAQPPQIAYERGATKKMAAFGLKTKVFAFDSSISEEAFLKALRGVSDDPEIDGILLLEPLPDQINPDRATAVIDPEKDLDGITPTNVAKVFMGDPLGFAPCTAEAVMETIHAYGFTPNQKKAVVVGRSMVVGRPVAMLLLSENATVSICHTKTADLPEECRRAEILVSCAGRPHLIKAGDVAPNALVIDVGLNVVDGKLCGDVDSEAVEKKARAVTPVPGGIGSVTTAVLAKHLLLAAVRKHEKMRLAGNS